jgi:predicted metal-dependent phosphoesterase TrpH
VAKAAPVRVDLHNHTTHSSDGALTPLRLLELAAARGLHCLAVTDHDSLKGGRECARIAAGNPHLPRVIPGEEVFSRDGEVVGLFLEEEVPSGLSFEETVALIRQQGGVVYLPHPFDSIRRGTIEPEKRDLAARLADIIEVRNGRMLRPAFNERAFQLAAAYQKPMGAGSDAHYAGEVGRAFLEMTALPDRENLVDLVRAGRVGEPLGGLGEAKAWLYHFRTGSGKLARLLRARVRRF